LKQGKNKLRIANEVTAPKASGFLTKPKEPFQPVLSHPKGCPVCLSGVNIESLAHTNNDRNPKIIAVLAHPSLLFGASKSDPEDIGRSAIDLFRNLLVLRLCQFSKGRRTDTSNPNTWEAAL